jgi:CubicO group peptidase (beta-lactamase class C family)
MPIATNTVFQIGSVTKLFTALGILQLAEKQKLSLNDSIQKYLPTFPAKGHTITIEHLLTHTSGIKDYVTMSHPDPNAMRRDFEVLEVIDFFKNEPLDFVPGTKSSYSSSGTFLLGYIIEAVSGIPYGKYIEDNIFKPAGMTHSYYGDNSKVIPNRANSYRTEEGVYKNADYRSMTVPYAAGALLSTVEDMFKWHRDLYDNKLLGMDLLTKAATASKLADGTKGSFGYGWFVDYVQVQGSPTLAHSGGISGFNSLVMYLPNEEVFVVVLSNLQEAKVQEITTSVATLAIGKELISGIHIEDSELDKYKGKYEMTAKLSRIALIRELEGKLIIEVINEWKAELSATTQTIFNIKNVKPAATLEFVKDDTGKVTKFVVNQGGVYEWKRID